MHKSVDEEPTNLRMRAPPPATNLDGLHVSLAESQRKAIVQAHRQDGTNPRGLEDLLEFHPQRFLMLGLDAGTYSAVIWVTS
jgi:hypothetical protein